MPMTTATAETTMPPNDPSNTEARLLDLLSQHLGTTEKALTELREGMDRLGTRIDTTSSRVFWLAIAILIVLAASSGASLYVQANKDGATVATGAAVSAIPGGESK